MTVVLKQYTEVPNAGDVASKVIVESFSGHKAHIVGEGICGLPNLIAIGSIVHWADDKSWLWGCGLIGASVPLPCRPYKVIAVRGHLSRDRLLQDGLTVPSLVGDPGVFVSDVFTRAPVAHDLGFVPHYVDKEHPYIRTGAERGVHIIDSLAPLSTYVRELSSCRRIISSSLHGIVIAHSFGIPAVWMELSDRVLGQGFKFFDYYSSIGIDIPLVKRLDTQMRPDEAADFCSIPAIEIDKEGLRAALKSALPEITHPQLETASSIP